MQPVPTHHLLIATLSTLYTQANHKVARRWACAAGPMDQQHMPNSLFLSCNVKGSLRQIVTRSPSFGRRCGFLTALDKLSIELLALYRVVGLFRARRSTPAY